MSQLCHCPAPCPLGEFNRALDPEPRLLVACHTAPYRARLLLHPVGGGRGAGNHPQGAPRPPNKALSSCVLGVEVEKPCSGGTHPDFGWLLPLEVSSSLRIY